VAFRPLDASRNEYRPITARRSNEKRPWIPYRYKKNLDALARLSNQDYLPEAASEN
jgi:gentisate 1,2-dioxygenase